MIPGIKVFGHSGVQIEGSRMFRRYCFECGGAMRVALDLRHAHVVRCLDCTELHGIACANSVPGMSIDQDPDAFAPCFQYGN